MPDRLARYAIALLLVLLALAFAGAEALAHGVAEGDKRHIQESNGVLFVPRPAGSTIVCEGGH
jgi:hypothetical protein